MTDELTLGAAIRALRDSVEARLRSHAHLADGATAPADQLESLHKALEDLRVGWDNLQAQSEQAAQEREHYAELFRLAPDAYVVTDTSGIIGELNLAAQQLLRFTPSSIVTRPLELFVAREHRSAFRTHLNAMLSAGARTARAWSSALGRGESPPVRVEFTVGAIRAHSGGTRLCWVLRREA
ncbi:MAG TPA: PAS domain-containing protein [Burkholderiales bacterium]